MSIEGPLFFRQRKYQIVITVFYNFSYNFLPKNFGF